jgi:dynein heavy chain
MLYDVMNGIKLRQLLWESIDQWEKQVGEWTMMDFNQLIPEDMDLITAKNVKNIHLFEKGLPPNCIVPKLHESVKAMEGKVNVSLAFKTIIIDIRLLEMCCFHEVTN